MEAEDDLSNRDIDHEEEGQQSSINISDVIEVIQTTDPSFDAALQHCNSEMFNGGGPLAGPSHVPQQPQHVRLQNKQGNNPCVRILEQPASKSLRFRYECEGRSAGSIPGINSTPENKTYPTIEIANYKGRAVVVVSCVTKDQPFRPHPHNLVGKDGCKKGVCTVEISSESMAVSFSNLGIQCVKKKDIEDALKVREEIRVDPFKTGFSHRSQPTSIDLNAVRLCFQVFLEGRDKGKFTHPLPPIVSDIIFDKKAMSELVICKMSHCSASVAGGREVILLCEKVAKEDISVRFYEIIDGVQVWEGLGDFQHANVHKQVAIAFRTPRYRTLDVEQSVKVCIQLRRPSDGAISEPLPFELLPLDSGRTGLLSRRRKTDYSLINQILASNINQKIKHLPQNTSNASTPSPIIIDGNNNSNEQTPSTTSTLTSVIERTISNTNGNITVDLTTPTEEVSKINNSEMFLQNEVKSGNNDRNLNDLLDQVAELDQIYSDNQTRISNMTTTVTNNVPNISMDIDDFDDRNTYTSLQLAFRNPISIIEPEMSYEDIITHKGPIIDVMPLKRDTEEKLPPLPPKRIKKAPSIEVLRPRAQTLSSDQEVSNNQSSVIELSRTQPLKQNFKSSVTRSVDRLPTNLPAVPPKKRSFLSRIFNRKSKEKSPPRDGKPLKAVGRSASSISGQRPNRFKQDVTHTSLKGSSGNLSLDPVELKRKRQKFNGDPNAHLLRHLQPPQDIAYMDQMARSPMFSSNVFGMSPEANIKIEPIEQQQSPSPYGGSYGQFSGMYRVPGTPSPQPHATPSPPSHYGPGIWSSMQPNTAATLLPPMLSPAIQASQDSTFNNSNIQPTQYNTSDMYDRNTGFLSLIEGTEPSQVFAVPNRLEGDRMNIDRENMTDSLTRLSINVLDQFIIENNLDQLHHL